MLRLLKLLLHYLGLADHPEPWEGPQGPYYISDKEATMTPTPPLGGGLCESLLDCRGDFDVALSDAFRFEAMRHPGLYPAFKIPGGSIVPV